MITIGGVIVSNCQVFNVKMSNKSVGNWSFPWNRKFPGKRWPGRIIDRVLYDGFFALLCYGKLFLLFSHVRFSNPGFLHRLLLEK